MPLPLYVNPACGGGGFDYASGASGTDVDTWQYSVAPDGSSASITLVGSAYSYSCGRDESYILKAELAAPGPPQANLQMADPEDRCLHLPVPASSCVEISRPILNGHVTYTWCRGISNASCFVPNQVITVMTPDLRYDPVITTEVIAMSEAFDTLDPVALQ